MERDFFESILFLSLQQKIDVKHWHAKDFFDLSNFVFSLLKWMD